MSTGWSPDGPTIVVPPALGWSQDGPTPPDPEPTQGWTGEQWAEAALTGDGQLTMGAYTRAYVEARLAGAGALQARAYARNYVTALTEGAGVLEARAYAKLYATADTSGGGVLTAAATIPTYDPVLYTGSGTRSATWWARYCHVALLGTGQTGNNGAFAWGKGGAAGEWRLLTLDLGQYHGPFTITTTAGATNNTAGASNPSTATWSGALSGSLTAPGGSGYNGVAGEGLGVSPQTQTIAGNTFTGGGQAANGKDGNFPGGGGGGGTAFYGERGKGAAGQTWVIFAQTL